MANSSGGGGRGTNSTPASSRGSSTPGRGGNQAAGSGGRGNSSPSRSRSPSNSGRGGARGRGGNQASRGRGRNRGAARRNRPRRRRPRSTNSMDNQEANETNNSNNNRGARARRGASGRGRVTSNAQSRPASARSPAPSSSDVGSPTSSAALNRAAAAAMAASSSPTEGEMCPICHTRITNLCITNCNHRFCRTCIRRWTSTHASCPTCRTTIHTIRNILPEGGTEIIHISRAELTAHKVNELHSILILLFTVMSHSLLPEVSNMLEQLNEISRELNIPTTTSRMQEEAARAARERSDALNRVLNDSGSSTPTSTSPRPTSASSASSNNALRTRQPIRIFAGVEDSSDDEDSDMGMNRQRATTANQGSAMGSFVLGNIMGTLNGRNLAQAQAQQSQQAGSSQARTIPSSPPIATKTSSPSFNQALASKAVPVPTIKGVVSSPTPVAAKEVATKQPVVATKQIISPPPTTQTAGPAQATPSTAMKSPPTVVSSSLIAAKNPATTQKNAASPPQAMKSPATSTATLLNPNRTPIYGFAIHPSWVADQSDSSESSSSSVNENPFIRHTYLTANQQPDPADLGPAPSRMTRSRLAAINRSAASRTNTATSRPPTSEETNRIREQRQKDIQFLTDSYNKINQVYEVLMIMHMVVHRNQVALETPNNAENPTSPNNSEN